MADAADLFSARPKQAVVFYSYKYHFGTRAQDHPDDTVTIDATQSVYSISVGEAKTSVSGNFSVILGPDQNWPNRVRPGDWCAIYVSQFGIGPDDSSNPTKGLRCLGNIDRVSKVKTTMPDGKIKIIYKVMGRNFGKIFEKTQFYYNPYIPDSIAVQLVISKSGFMKITGTPSDFLYSYLNLYYGDGFKVSTKSNSQNPGISGTKTNKGGKIDEMNQVRIPQAIYKLFGVQNRTGKLADILKIEIGDKDLAPDGYSLYIPPDRVLNKNLWQILQSISNPMINELYACMKMAADGKVYPTLVFRKLPFTGAAQDTQNLSKTYTFPKLTYIDLPDNIIVNEDLGFSDHERYNYINFDPKNPIISQFKQYMAISKATRTERYKGSDNTVPLFPFIDRVSINRYGITTMEGTSDFCYISEAERKKGSEKLDINKAEEWMKLMIDWWSNYPRTACGTFSVKGFNTGVSINLSALDQFSASTVSNSPTGPSIPSSVSTAGGSPANALAAAGSTVTQAARSSSAPQGVQASDFFCVGDNVFLSDRDELYHLESFELDWAAPGNLNVSFVVTHGVSFEEEGTTFQYLDELKFRDNAFQQAEEAVYTTYVKDKSRNFK